MLPQANAANKRLLEALAKHKQVEAEKSSKLEKYNSSSIGNRVRVGFRFLKDHHSRRALYFFFSFLQILNLKLFSLKDSKVNYLF